jgi:transposase-like protein
MAEERKTMDLEGLPAPALGVEERSDEAPSAGANAAPDPEVVAKPKRRRFTAEYRLRIVEEADRCTEPGDVGRLLRREGLYSSHLTKWREAHRHGALHGLRSKKRGVKLKASNPLAPKVRELEAKIARLEKDLHTAHTILDVQEKVAGLLGFSVEDGKDC